MINLKYLPQTTNKEVIVGAACMMEDEYKNSYLIIGARHYDTLMCTQITDIERLGAVDLKEIGQGFYTSHQTYVDRKEALKIALANNQVKYGIGYETDELYSEMLY